LSGYGQYADRNAKGNLNAAGDDYHDFEAAVLATFDSNAANCNQWAQEQTNMDTCHNERGSQNIIPTLKIMELSNFVHVVDSKAHLITTTCPVDSGATVELIEDFLLRFDSINIETWLFFQNIQNSTLPLNFIF